MEKEIFLITGQRGEIGRSLCSFLQQQEQPYLFFDDYLRTGSQQVIPGRLLHLAGRADETNPAALLEGNIDYLLQVIEQAEKHNIREMIFFSSASVYGLQNKEDVDENDFLAGPSLYGASKLLGERLLQNSQIRSLCLRLPAVLELDRNTNFITNAFERLRAGSTMQIYNGERLFNHFIDVPTLGRFITSVKLGKDHDIINVSCQKKYTLAEIINHMRTCIGSRSKIEMSNEEKPFFNLSISKAVRDYQFQPTDALACLEQWCESRMSVTESGRV